MKWGIATEEKLFIAASVWMHVQWAAHFIEANFE